MTSERGGQPGSFGLVGALGINLWLLGLIVPLLFARGGQGWVLAPIAPALLGYGIVRRSSPALLLGVPVAALAPLALPELEGARQHPWGFVVVLASLLAYVLASLSGLERSASKAPREVTPLPGDGLVAPWPRRIRIYRGLMGCAALFPALLIYAIDLHPATVAALGASFPGEVERAQAMMTALAGLVAGAVFALWLVRPLALHLDRDMAVRVRMESNKLVARAGRPRGAFYLAVGVALVLMTAVVLLHR